MKLLTPKQAAKVARVSRETIQYWVKTGRLAKYPYELSESSKRTYKRDTSVRYFMVSEEEVIRNGTGSDLLMIREKFPDLDLITRRDAAKLIGVQPPRVNYYVNKHNLKKYEYGRNREYLLDKNELLIKVDFL